MSLISADERRFEDHIEKELNSLNYSSRNFNDYDKELCLIKDEIIDFIKNTQTKKWNKLVERNGKDTEKKLLKRISSEISKRGIIHSLRNKITDFGIEFDLCYFQPTSDLNPESKRLYEFNKFTLVRQLHYSRKNQISRKNHS